METWGRAAWSGVRFRALVKLADRVEHLLWRILTAGVHALVFKGPAESDPFRLLAHESSGAIRLDS